METKLGIKTARILIVDDQQANVRLLESILTRAGYTALTSTTDSRKAVSLFSEIEPDLILLDLMMPGLDGFGFIEQITPLIPNETYLPIIVLTADITPQAKHHALTEGVKDFLTKPFDHAEVLLRIKNVLETRALHIALREQNNILDAKVRERTRDLEEAQAEILQRLAIAAEYRDDDTGHHTHRVGRISALIAQALGLPALEVELILQASPLHDIGKIGIPDQILLKPGKLTVEEFEVIKTHTLIGGRILKDGRSELIQMAELIAYTHHERWDGTGYPAGLSGEDIPLVGRIVTVADVFDALTHERPYKRAWPVEEAIAEIEKQSGRQFDQRVVEAFLTILAQLDLS